MYIPDIPDDLRRKKLSTDCLVEVGRFVRQYRNRCFKECHVILYGNTNIVSDVEVINHELSGRVRLCLKRGAGDFDTRRRRAALPRQPAVYRTTKRSRLRPADD
jgi:hypothetical protein